MKGSSKSFEELECWQAATEVRKYVMRIVKTFPPEEKFALKNDMVRAARSATHNIAEGFGRFHFQENIQFCRQSRGSLYELLDQILTAKDDNYISKNVYEEGKQHINKTLAILNGYINYLNRAKRDRLHPTINK
jgi:four helix bundle protein